MADAADLRQWFFYHVLLHPFNWVALTSRSSLCDCQTFSHLSATEAIVLTVCVCDLRSLPKLLIITILELVIGMLPIGSVLIFEKRIYTRSFFGNTSRINEPVIEP